MGGIELIHTDTSDVILMRAWPPFLVAARPPVLVAAVMAKDFLEKEKIEWWNYARQQPLIVF